MNNNVQIINQKFYYYCFFIIVFLQHWNIRCLIFRSFYRTFTYIASSIQKICWQFFNMYRVKNLLLKKLYYKIVDNSVMCLHFSSEGDFATSLIRALWLQLYYNVSYEIIFMTIYSSDVALAFTKIFVHYYSCDPPLTYEARKMVRPPREKAGRSARVKSIVEAD